MKNAALVAAVLWGASGSKFRALAPVLSEVNDQMTEVNRELQRELLRRHDRDQRIGLIASFIGGVIVGRLFFDTAWGVFVEVFAFVIRPLVWVHNALGLQHANVIWSVVFAVVVFSVTCAALGFGWDAWKLRHSTDPNRMTWKRVARIVAVIGLASLVASVPAILIAYWPF